MILDEIVAYKKKELLETKRAIPFADQKERARMPGPRGDSEKPFQPVRASGSLPR